MTKPPEPWRNRITGHEDVAPDQLMASAFNFRIHPKRQQDATGGSLDTLGWIDQIVVSHRSGTVIDGHLRVELALSRGEPTVPVVYVDLSPEEEKIALLSLDPIAAMAGTDAENLSALLAEVHVDNQGLQAMLDELGKGIGAGVAAHKAEEKPDDSVTCPACGFQWKLADGGDE